MFSNEHRRETNFPFSTERQKRFFMSLSVALPPLTGYERIRARLVKQIAFTLTELLTVIAIIAIFDD